MKPGDNLGHRYRLDTIIGNGEIGEVWRAFDTVLERSVAIKILNPSHSHNDQLREQFRQQALNVASLAHPSIIDVHDYSEDRLSDDTLCAFLVMDDVEAQPLSQILVEHPKLELDTALKIIEQTALAVHHAHQAGVVHGGLNPSNILVTPENNVNVTDFGTSAVSLGATQEDTDDSSAPYRSPNSLRGDPASLADDIYALGAVAVHCVTGAAPNVTHTDPPPTVPEDTPDIVDVMISRAMATDPQNRFSDAAAIAHASRSVAHREAHETPIPAPPLDDSSPASAQPAHPTATAEEAPGPVPEVAGAAEVPDTAPADAPWEAPADQTESAQLADPAYPAPATETPPESSAETVKVEVPETVEAPTAETPIQPGRAIFVAGADGITTGPQAAASATPPSDDDIPPAVTDFDKSAMSAAALAAGEPEATAHDAETTLASPLGEPENETAVLPPSTDDDSGTNAAVPPAEKPTRGLRPLLITTAVAVLFAVAVLWFQPWQGDTPDNASRDTRPVPAGPSWSMSEAAKPAPSDSDAPHSTEEAPGANDARPSPTPTSKSPSSDAGNEVPNVIGSSHSAAKSRLTSAGFEVKAQESGWGMHQCPVSAQDPAAGAHAKSGSTVTIELRRVHSERQCYDHHH